MRGTDERTGGLFSYVRLEDRVAADHPLRAIRGLVEEVLERLSARLAGLYSHTGRPSIPPEQMLKATNLRDRGATASATSAPRSVRTRPTPRPPIPMRGCSESRAGRRAALPVSAMP